MEKNGFNSKSVCPVTGLPIKKDPEWEDVPLGYNYYATFSLIGESILFTASQGSLSPEGITAFYAMREKYLEAAGLLGRHYAEIRDNSQVTGIQSREVRIQYSRLFLKEVDTGWLSGFWLFNAPMILKNVYNVGILLKKPAIPVKAVDDSKTAVTTAIDNNEPIHFEKALTEFEGDKDFLMEVLAEFILEVEEQIPKIQQAVVTKDADTLKQKAHAIKGGSANLTADELSRTAGALEDMGKTNHFDGSAEAFEAFEKAYLSLKHYSLQSGR